MRASVGRQDTTHEKIMIIPMGESHRVVTYRPSNEVTGVSNYTFQSRVPGKWKSLKCMDFLIRCTKGREQESKVLCDNDDVRRVCLCLHFIWTTTDNATYSISLLVITGNDTQLYHQKLYSHIQVFRNVSSTEELPAETPVL